MRLTALLLALMLLAGAAVLTGCHTVQGFGKDITAIGEEGQKIIDGGDSRTAYRR